MFHDNFVLWLILSLTVCVQITETKLESSSKSFGVSIVTGPSQAVVVPLPPVVMTSGSVDKMALEQVPGTPDLVLMNPQASIAKFEATNSKLDISGELPSYKVPVEKLKIPKIVVHDVEVRNLTMKEVKPTLKLNPEIKPSDIITKRLNDVTTKRLNDVVTKRLNDVITKRLNDVITKRCKSRAGCRVL